MITETAEVEAALESLRALGLPVNFQRLVIKGAEASVEEMRIANADETRRLQLREDFVQRMESGRGLDLNVLTDPSRPAWRRPSVERLLEELDER